MEEVFRYEKKFVLSNINLLSLENALRFSKLKFREHHPIRLVNLYIMMIVLKVLLILILTAMYLKENMVKISMEIIKD